MKRKELIL